jgi:uncharacterized protein YidB (DUF937 family)
VQFLDEAARGIYGPSASGIDPSSPIAVAVSALLGSRGGRGYGEGLRQLLDRFTHCGHGVIAQSWVDIGGNQPVTPNQLEEALGPAKIHALARQSGLPSQELITALSRHLPGIVDKLTPLGQVPDAHKNASTTRTMRTP